LHRSGHSTIEVQMRRVLVVLAAGVAVVLGLAGPAAAKGPVPNEVTIEGAGMDGSVTSPPGAFSDGSAWRWLPEETGLFEAMFSGTIPLPSAEPSTTDLGPAVELTWQLDSPVGGEQVLRQVVHPDAAGGPVVYTPPDQPVFEDQTTPGGWVRVPTAIRSSLARKGVTWTEPVPVASAGPRAVDGGGARWPAFAIIAALGAAMLVAVVRPGVRGRAAAT
jgi:hypothetical protein